MAAKSIAEAFLNRLSGRVQSRTQVLDANQLCKLAVTLGSRSRPDVAAEDIPPEGTNVPPGWHLVYFTPSFQEEALGLDGSDKSFNPDPPFTRRMWAGGRLKWHTNNGLKIGQRVTEHTKLFKADAKRNKLGDEMIVAGAEKQYETGDGIVLTDQREWVFRPELDPEVERFEISQDQAASVKSAKQYETRSQIIATSRHKQTPISLFRFSALTFNAHQIHYSLPWTQDIEGHKDVVVHAPLNLVLMLELYRKAHGDAKPPSSMEYRAVAPIYAHEDYTINLTESGEIWCEKGAEKQLCMTGKIQ